MRFLCDLYGYGVRRYRFHGPPPRPWDISLTRGAPTAVGLGSGTAATRLLICPPPVMSLTDRRQAHGSRADWSIVKRYRNGNEAFGAMSRVIQPTGLEDQPP